MLTVLHLREVHVSAEHVSELPALGTLTPGKQIFQLRNQSVLLNKHLLHPIERRENASCSMKSIQLFQPNSLLTTSLYRSQMKTILTTGHFYQSSQSCICLFQLKNIAVFSDGKKQCQVVKGRPLDWDQWVLDFQFGFPR